MMMDKEEQLEKDTVEQLLKYVPTVAERDLLNSHAHEMESFARPDRFLLEMSRSSACVCVCVSERSIYSPSSPGSRATRSD